jgi:hypothetical protein
VYDGLGVGTAAAGLTALVSVFATSPSRLQAVTGVGLGVAGAAATGAVTAGVGAAAAAATGAAAGIVEASPAGVVVTGSTAVGVIAARKRARECKAQRLPRSAESCKTRTGSSRNGRQRRGRGGRHRRCGGGGGCVGGQAREALCIQKARSSQGAHCAPKAAAIPDAGTVAAGATASGAGPAASQRLCQSRCKWLGRIDDDCRGDAPAVVATVADVALAVAAATGAAAARVGARA